MLLPVLGTGCLNAQKLSKNDAFDILTKWEGKWKNSAVFEKSIWITEKNETRGITETNLILSNNYVEIMVYNENNTSKHIIRYDQSSSQFNRWEFKSEWWFNNFCCKLFIKKENLINKKLLLQRGLKIMDHFNFSNDDWDSIPKMNKKQKRNFVVILILVILFFLFSTIYDIIT